MTFVRACSFTELEPDQPLGVELQDVPVALVRVGDEVFALRDRCSHADILLSLGDVFDCTLECFAHGSRFDLRTGYPLNLPATKPVPVYPVRVDGDDVLVDVDNPITIQEF